MKKVLVMVLACGFSHQLYADAAGEIAYRQAVMEVVGGHMKSIGSILRGKVHMEDLKFHTDGMRGVSAIVPNVFPAGSGEGKTESLPAIWEKPVEFKAAMDKYVKAANDLADVVDASDMKNLGASVQALGQSCKGCHEDFREDD